MNQRDTAKQVRLRSRIRRVAPPRSADDLTTLCQNVRFHNRNGDQLIESDVIVTTRQIWPTLSQSQSEDWSWVEAGPVVIAHRSFG